MGWAVAERRRLRRETRRMKNRVWRRVVAMVAAGPEVLMSSTQPNSKRKKPGRNDPFMPFSIGSQPSSSRWSRNTRPLWTLFEETQNAEGSRSTKCRVSIPRFWTISQKIRGKKGPLQPLSFKYEVSCPNLAMNEMHPMSVVSSSGTAGENRQ